MTPRLHVHFGFIAPNHSNQQLSQPTIGCKRDSLSTVLAPPLLATRMDEPAGRPIDWQATAAGCSRGTWPLWVTRRQLLHGRSSIGGADGVPSRRSRPHLHRLITGKSGSPEPGPCTPDPPCRAVLHRDAARVAITPHPSCCVMVITVTCIGTDAASPCLEHFSRSRHG